MNAKIWSPEKALDIIRKMVAKAESTDSAEERELFRKEAFELATKYEIDWALAYERGEIKEKVITIFYNAPKPFIQKMTVLNLIAVHTGCTPIRLAGFKNRLHVFGFESDMKLFRVLLESVYAQGEMTFATALPPAGAVPRTYRRGWWQGFAVGLSTQTARAKQEVTKESGTPTSALVLRDKNEAVTEEVGKAYPKLAKARRSRTRFTAGQVEGYEAGKRVDLGTGKLSGGKDQPGIAG